MDRKYTYLIRYFKGEQLLRNNKKSTHSFVIFHIPLVISANKAKVNSGEFWKDLTCEFQAVFPTFLKCHCSISFIMHYYIFSRNLHFCYKATFSPTSFEYLITVYHRIKFVIIVT